MLLPKSSKENQLFQQRYDISLINPVGLPPLTFRTKPPRARKEVRSPLSYNSVQEWLEDLKMAQYVPNFMDVGLTLKECCSLTEADVETLGVAVAGHRHKIFASIQCADGGELPSFQ